MQTGTIIDAKSRKLGEVIRKMLLLDKLKTIVLMEFMCSDVRKQLFSMEYIISALRLGHNGSATPNAEPFVTEL